MTTRWGARLESAIILLTAMLLLLISAPSAGALDICTGSECHTFCSVSGDPTNPMKPECADGESVYQICTPSPDTCLNGGLVVFAHGYVAPGENLQIPDYEIDGTTLPALVNQLGFVYATSSFPKNGLAIQQGIDDLVALASHPLLAPLQGPVYLVGASEGGAITALAVERNPEVFSGGLALCGPIGSFRRQIDYYGDFRAVFDYFFPNVLPGDATDPDPSYLPPGQGVRDTWTTRYVPRILLALQANPAATVQLLRVMRVPYDRARPETVGEAVVGILWYNVFATYDAIEELGGQPFDNRWRFYTGSSNDFRLNLRVQRYRAAAEARLEIAALYETSGRISIPVVTSHTTGDPIVPYWHELFYRWKTWLAGSGPLHTNLPVFKYGHCTFDRNDALTAFAILVYKVNAQGP